MSNNHYTREEVYLAALLHDIGKFWQRADEKNRKESKILSDYVKNNLYYEICPENENGYSHKHVLWTAQFFEEFSSEFKNLLKDNKSSYGDLMILAAKHHNPSNIYERIVQKADHYSAGMDRTQEGGWKDAAEEDDKNWDAFKRIKQRPIFSTIGEKIDTESKAPISPLSLESNFINYEETNYNYEQLWDKFRKEFKFIQNANFNAFTETLLALLEKYTIRIPASTKELPDVSLYDHLKTTAAFAICLYDYINEKNKFERLHDIDEKPFLLIGGDLSGIQKFIYSITPRGAAKNLKGRSFYLQLLINNIVNYFIDELNLYSANIIYQSGGGFYLIAPNTNYIIEKLKILTKTIEYKIFEYHKTELFLAIDYIEFGEENIFGNLGECWKTLSEKLGHKKGQRFKNIIKEKYDLLFTPTDFYKGEGKRDYITGEPIIGKECSLDDNKVVNELTFKQIDLGQKLKNADYWIQSKEKIEYWNDDYFNPLDLGYYNYFFSLKEIKDKEEKLKATADKVRIKRINNLDFLEPVQKGIENIYGFCFYGGNDYPAENNKPKLFEELAGVKYKDDQKNEKESSPNLVRLGILRMDVDNLGNIFKEGFKNNIKPSLSRYSTLSRSLDLFFSGYINTLWNSNDNYKNSTQIIYSGGDDLFIIGKWDVLIDFANKIYDSFKNWTCNNETFGISGGLAVLPPKFPLLKAALLAEDEEKNAKKHFYNGKEKNSFSFFNYSFRWDEELKHLIEIKDEIKKLLEQDKISQSFPSDMFTLMDKAYPENFGEKYDESFKYRVKWLVAYQFKRATQRYSESEIKEFYDHWGKSIFTGKVDEMEYSKYNSLQILAFAARWADYEIRSKLLNK